MPKLLLILFLVLNSLTLLGQSLRKGFVMLHKHNYTQTEFIFRNIILNNATSCEAYYGLALLYSNTQYPKANLFDATYYANQAYRYSALLEDKKLKFKTITIDRYSITNLQSNLEESLFKYVISQQEVSIYKRFITECRSSKYYYQVTQHYNQILQQNQINKDSIIERQLLQATIRGEVSQLNLESKQHLINWRDTMQKLALIYPNNIYLNGYSDTKQIALTFDDGPDAEITDKILDTLAKYYVKASFFFVGEQLTKYPHIAKRAATDGHLIANHSYSHPRFVEIDTTLILKQIADTDTLLKRITYKNNQYVRPPYGHISERETQIIMNAGYKTIIWSLDACDWVMPEPCPEEIIQNIILNVQNGDIILLHNKQVTLQALPKIIIFLRQNGYNFVTIDKIITSKTNTMTHYPNFK